MPLNDAQVTLLLEGITKKLDQLNKTGEKRANTLKRLDEDVRKVYQNQGVLQQSVEESLLTAQRADERAERVEMSLQRIETSTSNMQSEVQKNNEAFRNSIIDYNRLRSEWESKQQQWETRLVNIEQGSLANLHGIVNDSVDDMYRDLKEFKSEIESKYLTIEEYTDDAQNSQIQKYKSLEAKIKWVLTRLGIPIGIVLAKLFPQIIGSIDLAEIWAWLIENWGL